MTNLPSFITEDQDVIVPGDNQLKSISALAERQISLEEAISAAEEHLKTLNEAYRRVSELDLPEAMASVGAKDFTLKDGSKITVKSRFKVSITRERKEGIITWLMDHEQSGLVRAEVTVEFGKGDVDAARELAEFLVKNKYSPSVTKNVNTNSVEAVVNELIENSVAVPETTFGLFKLTVAKIKRAKR